MTQYISYKYLMVRIVTTSFIFWGYAQWSYTFYTCGYAAMLFMDNQQSSRVDVARAFISNDNSASTIG